MTKYGHFCSGGSEGNKSQPVDVHTRVSTEEAAAGGKKRGGGGISARVRSWLSAFSCHGYSVCRHPRDQSGNMSWTGNCFVL